jgi:cation diffusion facilitator CzcD-associated flavoprotein CzcO
MPVLENSELRDPKGDSLVSNKDLEADVLIIGGGFGGVYALWKFRQLGLLTKLLEAGDEFGGTWHWNRYPGARVDSEMPYYALSVPEVWKTWNWKERFPSHEELKGYFRHVNKTLDLAKDAYFNTIATSVKYVDDKWVIKTRDGGMVRCTYLILATGSSYKKNIPALPGLNSFKGRLIHAADWPGKGLDVSGKKVGVIGNGASGVQIVQELGKKDCELSLFVRNPIHALPMRQRILSVDEQETSKMAYSFLYDGAQKSRAGFPFKMQTKGFWQSTPEEREALMEEGWSRGGFAFNQGTYRDFIFDREANKIFYDFWAKKVRERVTDPKKAQIVAPIPQQVLFATKRPSLEQDYYDVINRPNVKVVDLKASPIQKICRNGIVSGEGLHELDIIVLATGYDAITGSLLDMGLEDKNGVALRDKWQSGVRTHLGLMIPKMPNLFMVYGPQAPTSFSNGPPIIEIQVDIIVQAVAKCQREQVFAIEATAAAAEAWADEVREIGNKTLYPTADSWYMGANIPGKPREMLLYLGGVDVYAEKCRAALQYWDGFIVTQQKGRSARASL